MKLSSLSAALFAVATFCGAMTASAATITYEQRAIDNTDFQSTHDYAAGWSQQSSAISSSTLTGFQNLPAGNATYNHLQLDFNVGSPTDIVFRLGVDADYGGELRMDGTVVGGSTSNLWWNYSWSNTAMLLTSSTLSLAAGHHVLDGFWGENCCGGSQSGQYSTDNGATWQDVNDDNLDQLEDATVPAATVPEPGVLALFGIGLLGFAVSRRKRA